MSGATNQGRAVAPGFTLPWNRTRTLADVWAEDFAARVKHDQAASLRKIARQAAKQTKAGRISFAGYDERELPLHEVQP